jgi:hypothetical protein
MTVAIFNMAGRTENIVVSAVILLVISCRLKDKALALSL